MISATFTTMDPSMGVAGMIFPSDVTTYFFKNSDAADSQINQRKTLSVATFKWLAHLVRYQTLERAVDPGLIPGRTNTQGHNIN